jgi:hypothetical protein
VGPLRAELIRGVIGRGPLLLFDVSARSDWLALLWGRDLRQQRMQAALSPNSLRFVFPLCAENCFVCCCAWPALRSARQSVP